MNTKIDFCVRHNLFCIFYTFFGSNILNVMSSFYLLYIIFYIYIFFSKSKVQRGVRRALDLNWSEITPRGGIAPMDCIHVGISESGWLQMRPCTDTFQLV